MVRANIKDVENLQIDGVDSKDYPDFCDAFFCYATWCSNGVELTDEQLQWLSEDYPEKLNEMAFESLV